MRVAAVAAFAMVLLAIPGRAQTSDAPLVQMDFGTADHPASFAEVERGPRTSTIKIVQEKGGGTVGQSMFVAMAFYQVAKARHFQYYVNLQERSDGDGAQRYIVGFTNDANADPNEEFGRGYGGLNKDAMKNVSTLGPFLDQVLARWQQTHQPAASMAGPTPKASPTP